MTQSSMAENSVRCKLEYYIEHSFGYARAYVSSLNWHLLDCRHRLYEKSHFAHEILRKCVRTRMRNSVYSSVQDVCV